MTRKRIATLGERGQLVRVFREERRGETRYVVQWGPKTGRRQRAFVSRAEAVAVAEGLAVEVRAGRSPKRAITVRALWEAYQTAEFPHLRPRSRVLYAQYFRKWEQFIGPASLADDLTPTLCYKFRAELDQLATATMRKTIDVVRVVYNWGERNELLQHNRWHLFKLKIAKERRTAPRAEYRQDEFLKIWRQFDPAKAGQWRAYVAVGLLGIYGARQNAILHLQWGDVAADALRLQAVYDKQGDVEDLPILPLTRELLAVARAWRERDGYAGPWILYGADVRGLGASPTYTIGSLWGALQRAERAAQIAKVKFRAGHGFRRMLIGDLIASTGDVDLALKAIGDKDVRMLRHYSVRRDDRIAAALGERARGFTEGAIKVQPDIESGTAPAAEAAGAVR